MVTCECVEKFTTAALFIHDHIFTTVCSSICFYLHINWLKEWIFYFVILHLKMLWKSIRNWDIAVNCSIETFFCLFVYLKDERDRIVLLTHTTSMRHTHTHNAACNAIQFDIEQKQWKKFQWNSVLWKDFTGLEFFKIKIQRCTQISSWYSFICQCFKRHNLCESIRIHS